jgi:hypothetical protein
VFLFSQGTPSVYMLQFQCALGWAYETTAATTRHSAICTYATVCTATQCVLLLLLLLLWHSRRSTGRSASRRPPLLLLLLLLVLLLLVLLLLLLLRLLPAPTLLSILQELHLLSMTKDLSTVR